MSAAHLPLISAREILAVLLAKEAVCGAAVWDELIWVRPVPTWPTLALTFLLTAFLIRFCRSHHPEERYQLKKLPLALLPWGFFLALRALPLVLSRPMTPGGGPSADALAAMGMVPYTEELLFRGIICAAATNRYGPVPGVLVSAVIFALDHRVPDTLPIALCAGLALGILFQRTGSLLLCVVCHASQNAAAFLCSGPVVSGPAGP